MVVVVENAEQLEAARHISVTSILCAATHANGNGVKDRALAGQKYTSTAVQRENKRRECTALSLN